MRFVLARAFGRPIPGPILALSYRRNACGRHLAGCVQEGLRGAREWSVWEIELFAALVSSLNHCEFCAISHAAVAVRSLGDFEKVKRAVTDWRTADLEPRLRAALAFVEKLSLNPGEIGRADVLAARAAGLNDLALREVIYVCFILSTMDRLADAFNFPLPDAPTLRRYVSIAVTFGYRNFRG
ncbi:MAG TPA: carboxymuconolactone decarboxylase family protein [Candidatus Angelobacter sp.]